MTLAHCPQHALLPTGASHGAPDPTTGPKIPTDLGRETVRTAGRGGDRGCRVVRLVLRGLQNDLSAGMVFGFPVGLLNLVERKRFCDRNLEVAAGNFVREFVEA